MRPRLLPSARAAALLYLKCDTQWHVGPRGLTGLRYAACREVFALHGKRYGLRTWRQAFADLQVIEHATLAVQAEQIERFRAEQEAGR